MRLFSREFEREYMKYLAASMPRTRSTSMVLFDDVAVPFTPKIQHSLIRQFSSLDTFAFCNPLATLFAVY